MKISALDAVAAPDGDETVVILKDGVAMRAPIDALAQAAVQPMVDEAKAANDPVARAAQIASFYDAPPYQPDGSGVFAGDGVDVDGYAGFGLNEKGEFVAYLSDATRGYIEVIHPRIVSGIVSPLGYVAMPVGADGNLLDATSDGFSFAPFDTGASPSREAAVIDEASNVALLTYGEGDSHGTRQDGPIVKFITESAGGATFRTADTSLKPAFASDATRLVHFIGFGQSNSLGFHATPGLDTTPLDPARAFQFPGSISPGEADDHTYLITDDRLGLLEPLSGPDRVGRGALGPRIVHRALPQLAVTDAALWSGHGVAGQSYANLRVGTAPWHNLRRGMVRGALQAWRAGLSYTIPGMVYVQGEDNYGSTKVDYLADLNELHDQFQGDARAITRDSDLVTPILLAQTTSWTKYSNLATSDVPLAQLQAMLDHPDRFAVFMAMYSLPYDEGIHLTSAGARLLDEYAGRAMAALLAGGDAAGLYPTAAARAGTSLTIDCHVPVGPLAIDTSLVSDPGQYGLVYLDGAGSPIALSNIAVAGTQVTATLASAVAGTLRFALDGVIGNAAGPTTGARCCIRDSAADVSAGGVTMRNYMLCSEIAVA